MELPDELWEHIKDFAFDWKRSHKQKNAPEIQTMHTTNTKIRIK